MIRNMAPAGAITFHGQKAARLAVFYLSLVSSANAIEQSGENAYNGGYTRQLAVACSGPQTRTDTVVVTITHRAAQSVLGVGDLNGNTFKQTTPPTGNPATEIWTATNINPCAWRNVTTIYFSAPTFSPAMRVVEYATRSPNSTPTPAPGLTPPPQASAAGFHTLSFDEEFSGPLDIGFGTTGHKWNANMWWEVVPSPSHFSLSNHVLTITGNATGDVEMCTQYHDFSGGISFLGGYFEARMMATDWSAFWLYCWDRPTVFGNLIQPSNPLTWTNEIDIMETDPGHPNTVFCTLHRNSSGDVVPDAQNNPDFFAMPNGGSVFGQWHTYGLLWTQGSLTWYVDNVKVASVAPYPSTWQLVQLILTANAGGVAGSPSNVSPPITRVQWVHVWK